jgi:hypothetical protein
MIAWARIACGTLLLAVPDPVLRVASGQAATARERAVTRVLGLRLLAQGAVTAVEPDVVTLAVSAETDFVHAATMLAWAAVDRGSRRLTLLSAASAGLFGVAGATEALRAPAVSPGRSGDPLAALLRLRRRAATWVARRSLPGVVRARLAASAGV